MKRLKKLKLVFFLSSMLLGVILSSSKTIDNKEFYASQAALHNDELIQSEPEIGLSTKRVDSLFTRLIIFPAYLSFDLITNGAKTLYYRAEVTALSVGSLAFDTTERKTEALAKAQKTQAIAYKSFRGMLFTPASIFWPNIVTNHFVPAGEGAEINSGIYASEAPIVTPASIEEVQQIVRDAHASRSKLSVIGAGYSQGKQTLPLNASGKRIDMSQINHIEIEGNRARVGAGATWAEVQEAANAGGLAVQVMQASNIFSIGGSLSANCHGWDHQAGALAESTNWIKVILDEEGTVQTLYPSDKLFQHVVGGWGMFGIIVEAEIELTNNELLLDHATPVEVADYANYFEEQILDNTKEKMHLYRLSLENGELLSHGWAQSYAVIDDRGAVSEDLTNEPLEGTWLDRVMVQTARLSPTSRDLWWKQEQKSLQKLRTARRNEIMRPKINAMLANNGHAQREWLQEYFIPKDKLSDFLSSLGKILNENKVALLNASVRFIPQESKSALGYAREADRFAVVLCFSQSLSPKEIEKTKAWVRSAIDETIACGGAFYLPYMHFATLEQFRAAWPQWEEIKAYKESVDPHTIFTNGLYEEYFATRPSTHEDQIVEPEQARAFLANVFQQVDVDTYLAAYAKAKQEVGEKERYEMLLRGADLAKGNTVTQVRSGLSALKNERDTLDANIQKIMDPAIARNGYVEIGMPGRMVRCMKQAANISGPITVINENESLIQSGWPKSHDTFQKLTYDPLALDPQSADVVSAFAGLHHCPEEKLTAFIDSIHATLRDGGLFLLREHDARDPQMLALANTVHTLFNAATGVTYEDEHSEVRNFKSLAQWKALLESRGFKCVSEPLIRAGDSSENALLKFVKVGAGADIIREKLISEGGYGRPQFRTHLTTTEWFNVEASQNLGNYENFWDYPYFQDLTELGAIYLNSWRSARQVAGFGEAFFSESNFTNLFITTAMGAECLSKGLINLPIWLIAQTESLLPEHVEDPIWSAPAKNYQKWAQGYAERLDTVPHFKQRYLPFISSYWKSFGQAWSEARKERSFLDLTFDRQTVKNVVTGLAQSVDMLVRAAIASLTDLSTAEDSRTIALITKGSLPKGCTIKHQEGEYSGVISPRYEGLLETLKHLSKSGTEVVEIAGQTALQVDLVVDKDTVREDALYERGYYGDADKKIIAVRADVKDLGKVLAESDVHRVYDY